LKEFKLELLEYQETAIMSVVDVFDGSVKNTFDNASVDGIRSNVCSLTPEQITENIKSTTILLNSSYLCLRLLLDKVY